MSDNIILRTLSSGLAVSRIVTSLNLAIRYKALVKRLGVAVDPISTSQLNVFLVYYPGVIHHLGFVTTRCVPNVGLAQPEQQTSKPLFGLVAAFMHLTCSATTVAFYAWPICY